MLRMKATPRRQIDKTRPLVTREYDIGGEKVIVSSMPKAGAREDAAAIIRRLIRKEIAEKVEK